MKGLIYTLLFIFSSLNANCQQERLSAEIDINYYHNMFPEENISNNLHYGASALISVTAEKVKVSLGINYAARSYKSEGYSFNGTLKEFNKLQYLNFPLIANITLSEKKIKTCALAGLVFNHLFSYDVTTDYLDGSMEQREILLDDAVWENTLVVGANFTKAISDRLLFNLSPTVNYRITSDYYSSRYNDRFLHQDILSLGIKAGIEYLIDKPTSK